MKKIFLLLTLFTFLFTQTSEACNNSTISIVSQVTNPDGSITYTLNLTTELGGLDASFYGFTLSFLSPFNTPTVILGGTYPTTASIAAHQGLSDPLTALVGAAVNSLAADSDWNIYDNRTDVISYEYGGFGSAAFDDFTTVIQVTVMGCVETIMFDASVNSAAAVCEKTVSTGQSCAPCNISALAAGTQTACNPGTNTYTQQVTVTYTNAPATGTLDVNGQAFAITASPQTVTLTGLAADGNTVNVTAVFSATPACTITTNNLFTAPVACPSSCSITALSAGAQGACNPATNTYTQQITVTYSSPPGSGTLDVNGQSFAITASPQTVTLSALAANGLAVNVTAVFSADGACTMTTNSLFTAPVACTLGCTPDNGTWD